MISQSTAIETSSYTITHALKWNKRNEFTERKDWMWTEPHIICEYCIQIYVLVRSFCHSQSSVRSRRNIEKLLSYSKDQKKKYSKIISLLQVDARYFTHRTIATHRWKGNIRRYRWTSMWEKYAWIECAVATTADHTKAQFIDGIVQVAWNADIIVESSSRVLWLMFDVGLSQLVALTSKLRSISQFPECYKYSALAIWYRILWPDKQKYRVPMHFGMRRALCYAHVCGLRHSIHSVCGHT